MFWLQDNPYGFHMAALDGPFLNLYHGWRCSFHSFPSWLFSPTNKSQIPLKRMSRVFLLPCKYLQTAKRGIARPSDTTGCQKPEHHILTVTVYCSNYNTKKWSLFHLTFLQYMFSPRGSFQLSSNGKVYKGLLHTRGIHHLYQKDVVGQPGVTQEVESCSFGDTSPMHLLKTCRPTANTRIINGLLGFKATAGYAIFKIPGFSQFLFCFLKILCWCPTKMLNISQHLIILYLSTFSIIPPCVNFPS